MIDGMCNTCLGIILKPMMAIFGLDDQAKQIQEAVENGDPIEITVKITQMACMIFGITSQCFTGDTLVSTENGQQPIENIKEGDYVWSKDTETGKCELKKVQAVSINETDTLVQLTTESGEQIDTTTGHPFYVEGKGFTAAGDLQEGDELRTKDKKTETVASVTVEKLDKPVKVYNLEIEENHTYFVSDAEVLVHNACGGSGEGGSDTTRVGRWMSQSEYDKTVETGHVQMSGDNKVHVSKPADIDAFGKQAPKGSIYVEFDVSINTISQGGTNGWGIINGPGSLLDRLNIKKGLPQITETPKINNIEIKGSK